MGGSLTVSAATGIDLTGSNLVNAVTLANSTSGSIVYDNNSNMTLAAVNSALYGGTAITVVNATGTLGTSGAITTMGTTGANISLQTAGGLTISNAVTAGGTGIVSLSTTGASSNISVNANVASTSGAISATAGDNLTLNAGLSTTGNVSLTGRRVGTVSEASSGVISGDGSTTSSVGGTTLGNTNTVTYFCCNQYRRWRNYVGE